MATEFEKGLSRILVAVRIRPLNKKEQTHGPQLKTVARKVDDQSVLLNDPLTSILPSERNNGATDLFKLNHARDKVFHFDKVFDEETSQEQLYEGTSLKRLVDAVMSGINSCVFAYGPTGTGKTHTMIGSPEQPGMTTLLMTDLFKGLTQQGDQAQAELIYLEIYNENIRDLLNPNPNAPFLDLRTDANHHVTAAGATTYNITSTEQVLELLALGSTRRTTEATLANEVSSRSHAILQVVVTCKEIDAEGRTVTRTGKLSMIDLAGSERAAATGNTGIRMIEGAAINRSLLALGNCINRLAGVEDDGAKVVKTGRKGKGLGLGDGSSALPSINAGSGGGYVNYRDSKLTRILSDSLGGNCRTVMIAACSPSALSFLETSNTLKYASRARNIQNYVMENVKIVEVGGVKRLAGDFDLLEYNKEAENQTALAEIETEAVRLNAKSAKIKALKSNTRSYPKADLVAIVEMYEELLDQCTPLSGNELSSTKKKLQIEQWKQSHGLAVAHSVTTSRQIHPGIRVSESNPNLSKETSSQMTRRRVLAGHHSRGVSLDMRALMKKEQEAAAETASALEQDAPVLRTSSRQRHATSPFLVAKPEKKAVVSFQEEQPTLAEVAPLNALADKKEAASPLTELVDSKKVTLESEKEEMSNEYTFAADMVIPSPAFHSLQELADSSAVPPLSLAVAPKKTAQKPLAPTAEVKKPASQRTRSNSNATAWPVPSSKVSNLPSSRRGRELSEPLHKAMGPPTQLPIGNTPSSRRGRELSEPLHKGIAPLPPSSTGNVPGSRRGREVSEPLRKATTTSSPVAPTGMAHALKRKLTIIASSLRSSKPTAAPLPSLPSTSRATKAAPSSHGRHYTVESVPDHSFGASKLAVHPRVAPLARGLSFPQSSSGSDHRAPLQKEKSIVASQQSRIGGVHYQSLSLTGEAATRHDMMGVPSSRKSEKLEKLSRLHSQQQYQLTGKAIRR